MNINKLLKLQVIGKTMQMISLNAHTLIMAFFPEKSEKYQNFPWKFKKKMPQNLVSSASLNFYIYAMKKYTTELCKLILES